MLDDATAADVVARALAARGPDVCVARVLAPPVPSLLDDVAELVDEAGAGWAPTAWLAVELSERFPDRHPTRKPEELGPALGKLGCSPKDVNRSWQGAPRKTWRAVTADDVQRARGM
jgi:hypothetical protein